MEDRAGTGDVGALFGQRIHVLGNSSSGKSTLAAELAAQLGAPVVELDALNWLPNWVGLNQTDPEEFMRRIQAATAGDRWVVAGSYSGFAQPACWDRLETAIWLDLPLSVLISRMLRRSWRRWRSRELLWGTNYESFWPQLAVWRGEKSLLWWIVTQYRRKQRDLVALQCDARFAHVRFVRLRSAKEVQAFRRHLELSAVST